MATAQNLTTTKIDIATSTDVINGLTDKVISLFSGFLVAASTVTLTIKDGSTALTGAMTLIAGVPFTLGSQASGYPYLTTTAGNALNFTLSSGVQVSGWIKTTQV
jgi:fumarate hydratase class II